MLKDEWVKQSLEAVKHRKNRSEVGCPASNQSPRKTQTRR